MWILITCLLLFATAMGLAALRIFLPEARYAWLAGTSGALLALISVFLWQTQLPFSLTLPPWQPLNLFASPILFRADGVSWALALSMVALTLATLLTAAVNPVFTNSLTWAGVLALGGIGVLAVTADNPLTLLLMWAALDLTELITQLVSVKGAANNEKVVISFATRVLGSGFLLWAGILSIADGSAFDFQTMPAGTGIFLVLAAGLRLGVLPLHLPYAPESELRRGYGTLFRLVSAASSLVVLGRVPAESLSSTLTPWLILFSLGAGLYGGWMWLRAPDELNGRPYWVIGLASLSVVAALRGSPLGAVAWGTALMLTGGALFLSSVQHTILSRAMFVGVWSISALPFSLTASAWQGGTGWFSPLIIAAQALMMAGFIRHTLRPSARNTFTTQPGWARFVYPSGIFLLLILQVPLGFAGWDGSLQVGAWLAAFFAALLTGGLVWGVRRFRIFNPVRAHWVSSAGARLNSIYQSLWTVYHALARLSLAITQALEGEGGIMWTLLFLALFVSLLIQGAP